MLVLAGCGGGDEPAAQSPATVTVTTSAEMDTGTTVEETTTEETTTTEADEPDETLADFILRVNEYLDGGQWGRAHEVLHPAQRRFISREQLADCMDETVAQTAPGSEYKIVEIYDEPWKIPGTKVTQPSKAVTVKIVVTYSEEGSDIETELSRFTQHAFMVGDRWAWIVSQDVVDDLRDDFC
jgi:hypothetical protein